MPKIIQNASKHEKQFVLEQKSRGRNAIPEHPV
jgi:hypothetical protein